MIGISANQIDVIMDREGKTLFATSDFNDLGSFRTRTHDLPDDHRTICIGNVQKIVELIELLTNSEMNPAFQSDEVKRAMQLAQEANVKVFPMSERV